jgi:class 3 adenylate cyclase/tetratricopeptide (TPR) repeat protein
MEQNPVEMSWPELTRARRALVVVDVVESVRLMQAHEADVIDRWRRFVHEVQTQVLPAHGGRLVKSLGDGMLLEFESVPPAVAAALDIQKRIAPYNAGREADAAMYLRVGAHVADVVVDQLDVYGAGVNLAARLATLAGAGEIVVSPEVRDRMVPGVDAEVEDLGECYVKHLLEPVRAYRLALSAAGDDGATRIGVEESAVPVLAVLPFSVQEGDVPLATIRDAVTDDVIAGLSRFNGWKVISRLSTAAFCGRAMSPQAIAKHLRSHYLLSGRLAAGTRLSLMLELASTRTGQIIWSDRFAGDASALMRGEDALVDEVVGAVGRAIVQFEIKRARIAPLRTLESYALLMAAINIMHRASAHEFDRARLMLEHLTERHPRMPAPHSWLGKWYGIRAAQGWSANLDADAARALDHVHRALRLDEDDSLAWTIDGLIHGYIRKDLKAAAAAYDRALAANPNEPLAWLYSATLHAWQDQGPQAAQAAARASSLSPLDPMRYYFDSLSSTAYTVAGQYSQAIELAKRSLRANRAHASTYRTLAIALVLDGQLEEARSTVEQLMSVEPALTVSRFKERYPGRASAHASSFAEALLVAGVPA